MLALNFMKNLRNKIIRILYKLKSKLKRAKRYAQINECIENVRPLNIMEIGVWNGNRAVSMIKSASKHTPIELINYYGFDLFDEMDAKTFKEEIAQWPPDKKEVLEHIKKETGANIKLSAGNTLNTLREQVTDLPKMDFIYIDGGHAIETVQNDWEYSSKLMHNNTVVIFDDYWPERGDFGGCKKIVDEIDRNIYDVEILPITDTFYNLIFGKLVIKLAKVSNI